VKKHYVAALILLVVVTSGHLRILKAQAAASDLQPPSDALTIPSRIGGYEQLGEDIDVGDDVRRVLETSLILQRNYTAPNGRVVQLSIVYAGTTRRSLHFPEVCLVGAGYVISTQDTMPIGVMFDARRLVLVKDSHRQAVLYWFKTEDQFTGNFFVNAWYWALNQIMFKAPTSAMIKVSTMIGPDGDEAAFRTLEDYAAKLAPILMETVN